MSGSEMNIGNEGTQIPKRIPVYVSKAFPGKLYLVQHPLKPAETNEDKILDYTDVKFKPEFDKFHFKVSLDQDSPCYDKVKSDNLGGKSADPEGLKDEPSRITSVTFEGSCVPGSGSGSNYVIALIKDNAVHLCPLEGIVQVKPTFEYLNKPDGKKQGGGDGNPDTETEDEEEATKVTVKFSRGSKEAAGKGSTSTRNRQAGSAFKEEEDTPWIDMSYQKYIPENLEMLKSINLAEEKSFNPVDSKTYLERLFPKYVEPVYAAASEKKCAQPAGKISISQLKQMSLVDQVRTLMIQGNVLKFQDIQEFLKTKLKVITEDSELIRTLHTSAYVVQGCWVVRSDQIYPPNYASSARGISRDVMIEARDFILRKFTEKRLVERKTLSDTLKLPVEEITEILRPIAKSVPRQGYEFIQPFDSQFASAFPDVILRQTQIWERKGLEQKNRKISGGDVASTSQRRRSRTKSMSSDTDSGAESEARGRRGERQRHNSTRSDASFLSRVEP